mmetsp:Transcript_30431/g.53463  ORF Transcript_30431/g.53463 Transcript_30431/m.53463 type:complete len:250 (-) Transcript_30431:234-983(-)
MRSGTPLQLQLAPLVWKQLVQARITKDDVKGVDVLSFSMGEALQKSSKDEFNFIYNGHYTGLRSDRKLCSLVSYGSSISVKWEDRNIYATMLALFREHEFTEQIEQIRRGLCEVVPKSAVLLHTPTELEIKICGKNEVDVDLLKRHTNYSSPYHSSHEVIIRFWEVFESFDHELRMKFLQFVWGRARLPTEESAWENNFEISGMGRDDSAFPISHTCFFQIELPEYSTVSIMREKLTYAITTCSGFGMG